MRLEMTASDMAKATSGQLAGGRGSVLFQTLSTDTRSLAQGSLFVALRGERFNGHDFLANAVASGAKGLLVAVDELVRLPTMDFSATGMAVIAVDDTRVALGDIAALHRRRNPLPTICITGSNGKTGTKELTAAALSVVGPVLKTPANYNNQIGVPLTLLELNLDHCFAVIECGTSEPGEIRRLAEIARPSVGVLTNVSPAHTEGLGDVEGVANEKGALFEALPEAGTAVVNIDDPWCVAQAERSRARCISFGQGEGADVRIKKRPLAPTSMAARGTLAVEGEELAVELSLVGNHHLHNAAAAVAAAWSLGVEPRQAVENLRSVEPRAHRMTAHQLGATLLLDDCYNANPASMLAALETLAAGPEARTVAVLGDMGELGAYEVEGHRLVGRRAADLGIDVLVSVGQASREMQAAAKERGIKQLIHFEDTDGAIAGFAKLMCDGDRVLIKGSRAMGLEHLVSALLEGGEA